MNISRPSRPARNDAVAPPQTDCGHRDCFPAEIPRGAGRCRSQCRSPSRPAAGPRPGNPGLRARLASSRQVRIRSAYARSVPLSELRVDTGRRRPRCDGVTACDKNSRLRPATAPSRAIGGAATAPAESSPGDTVRRSESRPRRGCSRNSRTSSCGDPPESSADDLRAAGTVRSIGPGSVVAPAPNRGPADSPAEESVFSTRRERVDSRTSCLDRQNTAEGAQIPGEDGGCPQKVLVFDSGLDPAPQADEPPLRPSTDGG